MSSFISKFRVSASTANILKAKIAINEFNLNIVEGPFIKNYILMFTLQTSQLGIIQYMFTVST